MYGFTYLKYTFIHQLQGKLFQTDNLIVAILLTVPHSRENTCDGHMGQVFKVQADG